jgi:DNA-binding CsgD family transcriptional regulator
MNHDASAPQPVCPGLTVREREIARLVADVAIAS